MECNRRQKAGILQLNGKKVFIYTGVNQIGRNKDAVAILRDALASQHHAQIIVINDYHYITDLKSTNGTLLNDTKLISFQLYELHDEDVMQFTPLFKGIYKKIPHLPGPEELTQTSNQSQLSHTQCDNFYAAVTQVHGPLYSRMLDDGEDESFANMNTQMVNRSIIASRFIHDLPTQLMPFQSDAATQVLSTQDFFKARITEKPEETLGTDLRLSESALALPISPRNATLSAQLQDNASAIHTDNPTTDNGIVLEDPLPQLVENSINDCLDEHISQKNIQIATSEPQLSSDNIESTGTTQLSQIPCNKKRNKSRIIESDTESEEESAESPRREASDTDIEDTIDKSEQMQTDITKPIEIGMQEQSVPETNLDSQINCQSDDSMDYLKMLSPNTPNVKSPAGVESISDGPVSSNKSTSTQNKSEIDAAVSDTDVEDNDWNPLENAMKRKQFTKRTSKNTISDSSDDEVNDTMQSGKGNKTKNSASTSRFIISSSEDEENEPKNSVENREKIHDSDVDEEEQESILGWGKSKCDISVDEVPATQNAICGNTSSISLYYSDNRFKKKLQQIETVAETSILDHTSALDASADKLNLNAPAEPSIPQPKLGVPESQENCDFLAPTQSLIQKGSRIKSSKANNSNDIDFDAATQKISDDIDFKAPTQTFVVKSINSQNASCSGDFLAPTQPVEASISSKKSLTTEESAGDCDFNAETQKITVQFLNQDDRACFSNTSTQQFEKATLPLISTLSNTEISSSPTSEATCDFLAPTQPLDKRSNSMALEYYRDKLRIQEADDEDFIAPTQPLSLFFNGEARIAQTSKHQVISIQDNTKETEQTETAGIGFETSETNCDLKGDDEQNIEHDEEKTMTEQADETNVQSLNDIPEKQHDPFQQVESQLQCLFASQTVTTESTNRPVNPMAVVFDELPTQDLIQSTQDVITTLSSNCRKRNSDDFESESSDTSQKRLKIANEIIVSESNTKGTEECKDSVVILNDCIDTTTNNNNVKNKKGILSLNKRDVNVEMSDDEHSVDASSVVHGNLTGKPKKRVILDDDTLSQIEYSTPPRDSTQGRILRKSVRSGKPALNQNLTRAKRGHPQKTTKLSKGRTLNCNESSSSSVSEEESESSKVDAPRRSSRVKKVVSYNESAVKTINAKVRQRAKEIEDIVDLEIRVPKRQNKFISNLEGDSSEDKRDISTIVQDCLKPTPRKSRAMKKSSQNGETAIPATGNRSIRPKIVFTMLNDPALKSLIRSLGGSVVETTDASTVLVTKSIQRTLKLLATMGQGKPICSPEWLHACRKANKFLDPWDFIIEDEEAEEKWGFKMKESLQHAKRHKLFTDFVFHVIVTTSADTIKGAIEANGGQVSTRKCKSGNFIVVAAEHQRTRYSSFLKENIRVVSSEAILIAILRQKIEFTEYLLD